MKTPTTFIDETVAIEPRCDSSGSTWIQPTLTKSVDGFIRIPNLTSSPVVVTKHQHLVQAYLTTTPDELDISPNEYENTLFIKSVHSNSPHRTHSSEAHSSLIDIDPDKQLELCPHPWIRELRSPTKLVLLTLHLCAFTQATLC